ncbi:MAG: cation transporter [Bacteroidetes bacterium]|nr:cation transporter [Bacteroidota bacterium]
MKSQNFKIDGMSCQHCVKAVENELSKLKINSHNVEIGLAKIEYEETIVEESEIVKAIEEAGYEVDW